MGLLWLYITNLVVLLNSGFNPPVSVRLPDWSRDLSNYYYRIRVEKRDKAKLRRYYRYVAKEKLRLVESGIDADLVNATCRYLAGFNVISGRKLQKLMVTQSPQLSFDFM